MKTDKELPIVCDLTVFSTETRQQMAAAVPDMFQAVQIVEELPNGYALQFAHEPGLFMTVANFVEHERQCCPFFHFTLDVAPNSDSFWLRLTGGKDVKAFIQSVWGDVPGAVSKQLIKSDPTDDLADLITQSAPVLANTLKKADLTADTQKPASVRKP